MERICRQQTGLFPSPDEIKKRPGTVTRSIITGQMIDLLVLARNDLIPRSSWIDLCLKVHLDPGKLVEKHAAECVQQVDGGHVF